MNTNERQMRDVDLNKTREEKLALFQQLKQQVLLREGFKEALPTEKNYLGRMAAAFPNKVFPFAALHEFFCFHPEEVAATAAFVHGLLSAYVNSGTVVWVGSSQKWFPPALKWFGMQPHQILFLRVTKEKDISWAIDEALKCSSLSAVVGELPELNLTASRRFQLTIEEAGVGCFVLRHRPQNLLTTAVSRWHIQPQPSLTEKGLPGIGHPRWKVSLLKVRNGQPGSWDVEWSNGGFRFPSRLAAIHQAAQKQTG